MRQRRSGRRVGRAVLRGAAAAGVAGAAVRRPWLHSGATGEEVTAVLPGDELLPYATVVATRATRIAASPEAVWPWLAQIGTGRAGWYGLDAVDNGGRPSLAHLDPDLQAIAVGQRISDATGPFSFEVVRVDPGRALVLQACLHPVTGRPVPPERRDPDAVGFADAFLHLSWAFVLVPHAGGTRLVVRVRYLHSRGAWVRAMVEGYELVDAVFAARMLAGIRARAEGRIHDDPPPQAAAVEPGSADCPLHLEVDEIAAFLNAELLDHPSYGGIELQRYADPVHGTGVVAFISRADDRRTDVYVEAGLHLDRHLLEVGAGLGAWHTIAFDRATLEVHPDGVTADVAFTDADGHHVEVDVCDRDGRLRRRGALLAPVGAAAEDPDALMLVRIGRFDLVRATGTPPMIRIGGRPVRTGALPAAAVHGRHLIKYGTDLLVIRLNPGRDVPVDLTGRHEDLVRTPDGAVAAVTESAGRHAVRIDLDPPIPALAHLHGRRSGRWTITPDPGERGATPLTGGTWHLTPTTAGADLRLAVTRRWRPRGLPPLMRTVTTAIPTFRTWPTTYAWHGTVDAGPPAKLSGRWTRTGDASAAYRRVTQRR